MTSSDSTSSSIAHHGRCGTTRNGATRRVRGEFGGIDPIKEEHRDARGVRLIEVVWQDMRYAVGHLRRAPALAVTVVLSLGVSI